MHDFVDGMMMIINGISFILGALSVISVLLLFRIIKKLRRK